MTYLQAIAVSRDPGSYTPKDRWDALVELQIYRATSSDHVVRMEASDGIERLLWWGDG